MIWLVSESWKKTSVRFLGGFQAMQRNLQLIESNHLHQKHDGLDIRSSHLPTRKLIHVVDLSENDDLVIFPYFELRTSLEIPRTTE